MRISDWSSDVCSSDLSYIVQGVSFEIAENEIVALLGRNGAGKTSTLRAIARTDQPALVKGEIWLGGTAIHPLRAFEAACQGIQLVPEDRRIIPGLTVEENLTLAQVAKPTGWTLDRIYGHFPRLAEPIGRASCRERVCQ